MKPVSTYLIYTLVVLAILLLDAAQKALGAGWAT